MKYIMLEIKIGDLEKKLPIIFPDELVHAHVAEAVLHMIRRKYDTWDDQGLVSAGSIQLGMDIYCNGESETLNLKSNPEDSHLIAMYPYEHGIVNA